MDVGWRRRVFGLRARFWRRGHFGEEVKLQKFKLRWRRRQGSLVGRVAKLAIQRLSAQPPCRESALDLIRQIVDPCFVCKPPASTSAREIGRDIAIPPVGGKDASRTVRVPARA